MNERHLQTEQAAPWSLVDELGARRAELDERCPDILHAVGNVMHPRPPGREEAADGRVRAGGREQLDPTRADEKGCRVDALVGDERTMLDRGAEVPAVGLDRGVDVVHCDPDVMDAAGAHAADRIGTREAYSASAIRSSALIVPTVSDELDSDSVSERSARYSSRSIVSFSRSVAASRSRAARCFVSRRFASAYA